MSQDILINSNEGKKYNRVLLLLTDNETEEDADGLSILDTCVNRLSEDGYMC